MRCKSCGASISENEEKCPYCDSYIDHHKGQNVQKIPAKRDDWVYNKDNEDKLNPLCVIISILPLVGIILGIMALNCGMKKCGTVYLTIGIVSLVGTPFVRTLLAILLF